jgi:hypothetical protein
MITFKKVSKDLTIGSTKTWNADKMKHEAIWTISTAPKNNTVYKNGVVQHEAFTTIADAKKYIENIELKKGLPMDEIETGFRDGGGWSGGCCITSDGKGFSWYKDKNGNIIRN